MNLLGAVIVGLTVIMLVVAACYARFVSPFVRWHFGEESRRDYEARRRRKEFEHRCVQCLGALFLSGVAGDVRGAFPVLAPNAVAWTWALQIGVLVGAGLFAWAAVNRWRDPFEN